LRDEFAQVKQDRAGRRIAGVGVGLDDDRRLLGALVVVAG
jgi:hypothetical protein